MHIENVIFLILSKNAYTKFSAGPLAIITSVAITFVTIYLWYTTKDTGYFSALGALTIPALVFPFGCKVFSAGTKEEICQKYLDEYKEKLKDIK